jgi:hypothetical protein
MTEVVARGRADVMQIQDIVAQRNLFGTRPLVEEGDDALERHAGLRNADHSIRVLVQGGSFSLEDKWRRRGAHGLDSSVGVTSLVWQRRKWFANAASSNREENTDRPPLCWRRLVVLAW